MNVFMQFVKDKLAVSLTAIDLWVIYKDFTAKLKILFTPVHCLLSFIGLYRINTAQGNVFQSSSGHIIL